MTTSPRISRRALAKGAAWAVPTLALGSAAPALAASGCASTLRVLASDFPAGTTGVVGGTATTTGVLQVSASYNSPSCNTTLYNGSYFREYTVTWTIKNVSSTKTVSSIQLLKPWMASRSSPSPNLGWQVMSYAATSANGRYWWTGESQTCGYDSNTYTNGCINWGGMNTSTAKFGAGRTANLDVGVGVGTGATLSQGNLADYGSLVPTTVAGTAQINPYKWTMPSATTPSSFPVYTPNTATLAPGASTTFTQILSPESTYALSASFFPTWTACGNTNDTFEGVMAVGAVCP